MSMPSNDAGVAGQLSCRTSASVLAVCTPTNILQRDQQMQQRRAAQEVHHHKQVWSKRPHGGPYYKVVSSADTALPVVGTASSTAVDPSPMQQAKQLKWLALGYERVKVGCSTNIVGDAMSKAAVDLVHAQLRQDTQHKGWMELHWAAKHHDGEPVVDKPGTKVISNMDVHHGHTYSKEHDEFSSKQARARFQALWCRLQAQGKVKKDIE